MLRKILGILVVLVLFTGIILAAETKGKVMSYKKGVLTVADKEYMLTKDATVSVDGSVVTGKDRGKALKDAAADKQEVTITYDKDGDKITVKKVEIKTKK